MDITIDANEVQLIQRARFDLNGPENFAEDREAFGFLPVNFHLRIMAGFKYSYDFFADKPLNNIEQAKKPIDMRNHKFTILADNGRFTVPTAATNLTPLDLLVVHTAINFGTCEGGNDDPYGALLRAILVMKGHLYPHKGFAFDSRSVHEEEIQLVSWESLSSIPAVTWKTTLQLIGSGNGQFILSNYHALVAMSTIVFLQRGHHFVGSEIDIPGMPGTTEISGRYTYSQLYRAMWNASFPGTVCFIQSFRKIFRTALHPFGVNALYALAKSYQTAKHLPASLETRLNAAPAGCAKITTAAAVCRMMSGSPFMTPVKANFQNQVANILQTAKVITEAPAMFHIHYRLYGYDKRSQDITDLYDRALIDVQGIAPFLVGFIQSQCVGAPIEKQRTLNKLAEDQMALTKTIKIMFDGVNENIKTMRPQEVFAYIMPAPSKKRRVADREGDELLKRIKRKRKKSPEPVIHQGEITEEGEDSDVEIDMSTDMGTEVIFGPSGAKK